MVMAVDAWIRAQERAMVHPDVGGSKNADGISITAAPISQVRRSAPNQTRLPRLAVMNAKTMDYYMANTL